MTISEFLKLIKIKGTNSAYDIDKKYGYRIWTDKFGTINPITGIPYSPHSLNFFTEKQLLSSEFKDIQILKTELYIPNTQTDEKNRLPLTIIFIIDHDKYIRTRLRIIDKEREELVQKLEFKPIPKNDESETTEVLQIPDSNLHNITKIINIYEDNYNDGRTGNSD